MDPFVFALAIGLVALASAFVTEAVRRSAMRRSILDVPNARSSHAVPTPRGGGVAIVVVLMGGWLALAVGGAPGVLGLALPALAVAAISAVDDIRSLPARARFGVHLGASVAVIAMSDGWDVVTVPVLGDVELGVLALPLGMVWLVGLTNAYNFMDGVDGIAGVQAVVAGTAWAALGVLLGAPLVSWTGGLIAGAAFGFLRLNWSPAGIFMGDVGSAFLGFVFAALVLVAGAGRIPLASLLFVWPFVFDAGATFVHRLVKGENVFEAHRSHLYQRLVIVGRSHGTVASVYGALAAATASAGLAWAGTGSAVALVVGLLIPPAAILPWVWVDERRQTMHRARSEDRTESTGA